MAALRELLLHLGVEVDQKPLEKADRTIGSLLSQFKDFGAALAGGFFVNALKNFVGHQIEIGDQLGDMAERLGVGTDELQRLGFAAQLSGASAEDAAAGLRFLNRNIGQALEGGGEAAQVFQKLGVSLKDADGQVRETGDLIPELADAFEKMGSHQERAAAAMQIFGKGGAALVPLLAKGSKGVKELFEDFEELGGGMSKEFVEAAGKADDQLIRLRTSVTVLKSRLALAVLPTVTNWIKKTVDIAKWLQKLQKETYASKTMLVAFAAVAGGTALFSLFKLAKSLGFVAESGSGILGVVKGIISMGIEALLVVAAVAALYLIFDDLFTLFEGGDSVIGDVIDSLFGVGESKKFVEEVKATVNELAAAAQELVPAFLEIGSVLADVFKVGDVVAGAYKVTIKATILTVKFLLDVIKEAIFGIGKLSEVGGGLLQKLGDVVGVDAFKNIGSKLATAGENLQYGQKPIGPPTAPRYGETSQTIEQNNQTYIKIEGGPNAQATANAVAAKQKVVLGDANQQAVGALAQVAR